MASWFWGVLEVESGGGAEERREPCVLHRNHLLQVSWSHLSMPFPVQVSRSLLPLDHIALSNAPFVP